MSGVVIAETVRRHVTSVWYMGFVALLGIIALGAAGFDRPGMGWPSLVALLAFVAGCVPIGPEFSSGTLQLILTKPINRSVYLISRVAGVVCAVWIATLFAFLCELLGRLLWTGDLRLATLSAMLLHSAADTILICALLAFFGSFTRAYFNIAIYFALMAGVSIMQGMLAMIRSSRSAFGAWLSEYPMIERTLAVIERNLFPEVVPRFDRDLLLLVLSNAAIALVLACFLFREREVPYGAD